MAQLATSVVNLIEQFSKLPGIGRKSAERLTYHVLRVNKKEALELADSIRAVRENVCYCKHCFNLSETETCSICEDPKRDSTTLCVVEQPRDLLALEQSGTYSGQYHVLLGRIAPLEGIGPENLTIKQLYDRVQQGTINEIIMATNPTVEGDGTALHISNIVNDLNIKITRLARGITAGSILEFTNKEILADAITDRQEF
ncbi:MAG: recombination mediator RecR [Pirellulaceae bacterium]|jgi:recombination protein RecR|nr:recombination mediator RecR [Mariniblastus sp.]MDB4671015.1 recombination mediator RecR [Pirellulaceae bacterium]MDB4756138.1 recombination mediator RecR [Mariniblastus sp.]MDG2471057.1 recombination mediator RecR [Pirellulaceae bacterium]